MNTKNLITTKKTEMKVKLVNISEGHKTEFAIDVNNYVVGYVNLDNAISSNNRGFQIVLSHDLKTLAASKLKNMQAAKATAKRMAKDLFINHLTINGLIEA